jgi:hypothetical protein
MVVRKSRKVCSSPAAILIPVLWEAPTQRMARHRPHGSRMLGCVILDCPALPREKPRPKVGAFPFAFL